MGVVGEAKMWAFVVVFSVPLAMLAMLLHWDGCTLCHGAGGILAHCWGLVQRGAGRVWWWLKPVGGVSIVDLVECDDCGEDVLEQSGEAVPHVQLIELKIPFKVFVCSSGDSLQDVCKPVRVMHLQGHELSMVVALLGDLVQGLCI